MIFGLCFRCIMQAKTTTPLTEVEAKKFVCAAGEVCDRCSRRC